MKRLNKHLISLGNVIAAIYSHIMHFQRNNLMRLYKHR